MRLADKVVFVTGAGGGIGRAMCERFLAEGAKVIATDIDLGAAQAAVGSAPDSGLSLLCDVGEPASVSEAIGVGAQHFGGINVLCGVHGGSSRADGGVTVAPEEEFWRIVRLELFGSFLLGKFGIPELIKAGGGSVMFTTSMCAVIGTPDKDCYTAAKGGVVAMARSMAVNYAADRVRVNTIAPGLTMTPRVAAASETPFRSAVAARHLLGVCKPIDIAHMAVYLASDESAVVTGQELRVDSGITIH